MEHLLKTIVRFILAISVLTGSEINTIKSLEHHFELIFKNTMNLRIFYDSNKDRNAKSIIDRLIKDVSQNNFVKENKLQLGIIDISKTNEFLEHYKFKNKIVLVFFIHNQMIQLSEFEDLIKNSYKGEN